MDKEFIIKQSQKKQLSLILLGIMMVAGSIFVFCSDLYLYGVYMINKIIGAIGIVFFGACLFFIIKRYFNPQDILIIDRNGVTDNSSAVSIGFIPWCDIKSMNITSVFTQTFVSMEIKNFEKKFQGLSFFKKLMISLNMKMGYPPVSIVLNSTEYTPQEVLKVMQNFKDFKE